MNSLNDNRRSEQPCRQRRGFSLTELIVVMAIIALLGTLIFPVVGRAVARARQTECRSNLRQFAAGLMIYRAEHRGKNPDWLSSLYPDYVDSRELYICPSDRSRGMDGGKPESDDSRVSGAFTSDQQFEEIDDNSGNTTRPVRDGEGVPLDIDRCSYFYEFCNVDLTPRNWWEGDWLEEGEQAPASYTWQDYKMMQLEKGMPANGLKPYSESRLPIIRCFHHWKEGTVSAVSETGGVAPDPMTINVGYAGNVFAAPLRWELRQDMTSADR